jgi:hypothetical protein
MPLPSPHESRELKHRRSIDVTVYRRPDGLWEVDARLVDLKTRDTAMVDGLRPAGTPIHDLMLRLVVDERLDIVEAGSDSPWVPYTGLCGEHGDAYARLAGLNLLKGFRSAVRERLGGVHGCTHLTELAQSLPTAVLQGVVGEVIDPRGSAPGAGRPAQIDRCHALRADGEAVRLHYPRWYRQPRANNSKHNPAADSGSDVPGVPGGASPLPRLPREDKR